MLPPDARPEMRAHILCRRGSPLQRRDGAAGLFQRPQQPNHIDFLVEPVPPRRCASPPGHADHRPRNGAFRQDGHERIGVHRHHDRRQRPRRLCQKRQVAHPHVDAAVIAEALQDVGEGPSHHRGDLRRPRAPNLLCALLTQNGEPSGEEQDVAQPLLADDVDTALPSRRDRYPRDIRPMGDGDAPAIGRPSRLETLRGETADREIVQRHDVALLPAQRLGKTRNGTLGIAGRPQRLAETVPDLGDFGIDATSHLSGGDCLVVPALVNQDFGEVADRAWISGNGPLRGLVCGGGVLEVIADPGVGAPGVEPGRHAVPRGNRQVRNECARRGVLCGRGHDECAFVPFLVERVKP